MKIKIVSFVIILFLFTSCATNFPSSFDKKSLVENAVNSEKRFVKLKKTTNFRDVGGISTIEGKTIKWGKIYRSDNLSKLKEKEFTKFKSLKIETVIDLRTEAETSEKEDNLPTETAYISIPIVSDQGDLMGQMKEKVLRGEVSEEESKELMREFYSKAITENIPLLRASIQKIIGSENAILYHCSAGKDRTGIVTALLLSLANVDRATIVNEYLLSNYYRKSKIKSTIRKAKFLKIIRPKINTNVILNFMSVDEIYINTMFEIIDNKYGGMDSFITNELKIDDKMRKNFIEKITF
ncbi:tyrosine-protein phosphatase [Flavobacterium qiangtangense]|uniref:Tyrosine-protein phosphatase n=1 Tax=Flavobacterium qiangtangense TaxID=1442595 RepID=A0ABW1PIV8_9FLAO